MRHMDIQMKYEIYNKIKKMIISGEIKPNTYVSEKQIAEQLGVSRTPVREAIYMLEADGILEHVKNKGAMIPELTLKDIISISQVREAIEGMAARIACDKANKETLRFLIDEYSKISDPSNDEQRNKSAAIGRKIHAEIVLCTENDQLIKIYNDMSIKLNQIMVYMKESVTRTEFPAEDHIRIATHILNNDYEKAEKAMRSHIQRFSRATIEHFNRHLTKPDT